MSIKWNPVTSKIAVVVGLKPWEKVEMAWLFLEGLT